MEEIKKRLRVFAGPNGSGKSTLFKEISKKYNTGYFINSDVLERILEERSLIDLEDFKIRTNQDEFITFCKRKNSITLIEKASEKGHPINLEIKENFIVDKSEDSHSYEGALISSFLREKLMQANQSFCFETVMSHAESKLAEIKEAKNNGYKTYLYFVCIDDPEVNISRVENRVQKGGHDVDHNDIVRRYTKTLNNLFSAIEICDKVYLFDNSGEGTLLLAEIHQANSLKLHVDEEFFPNWFKKYVLQKWIEE